MPTPPNVNQMPADQRLSEVADILATGLLRLRFRTRVVGEDFLRNPLEGGRPRRPHVADLKRKGDAT